MKTMKVVIIDYEVGNTFSVRNALNFLGYDRVVISSKRELVEEADVLILPGVGAFDEAMKSLERHNLLPILNDEVVIKKKPILGICLGMQMLASISEENGRHVGLNWIPGTVKRLELGEGYLVPHAGWNEVVTDSNCPLFKNNQESINYYFDHSYFFDCDHKYAVGWCDYGIKITAAVQNENIFGVQFHPEKSQTSGLKLFRNFFNSIS